MMSRFHKVGVVVLLCAVLAGCGTKSPPPDIVTVEGRVTLNGKSLPKASVSFYPMIGFDATYIATAETDEDGRFKLTCRNQPGACACENRVTVTEGEMPGELRGMSAQAQMKASKYLASLKNRPIPEKYGNLAQSPLTFTVSPDRTVYDIDLTR